MLVQFRVFTKLMPFSSKTTKFWCFWCHFLTYRHLWRRPNKIFCISTFTYDNSLTILKISSSSFKPFRSYSLFFFELYIYIIGFLETLYTSDVTASRHPLSTLYRFVRLSASTLKIHNFSVFEYFLMRFFFVEFVWLRRFVSIHSLEDSKVLAL